MICINKKVIYERCVCVSYVYSIIIPRLILYWFYYIVSSIEIIYTLKQSNCSGYTVIAEWLKKNKLFRSSYYTRIRQTVSQINYSQNKTTVIQW